jgi:hypothetical protein
MLGAMPARAAAPLVDYELFGTVGQNGWYVGDVTIVWDVTLLNGPPPYDTENCGPTTFVDVDTTPAGVTETCTASNGDGTVMKTTSPPIRRDATKPNVTSMTPSRDPDQGDWFNHPLNVVAAGTDASSGIAACATASYSGPDSPTASVAGTCSDRAGNVSNPVTRVFRYDATPPEVDGITPARPPDFRDYFTSPVALAFSGHDQTAGIAGCDTVTYAGPDGPAAPVTGSCRDAAGNAASRTLSVRFDGTGPSFTSADARAGDSSAALAWRTSGEALSVRVERRPGPAAPLYEGEGLSFRDNRLRNGVRYRYLLIATDAAGHETRRELTVRPTSRLLAPGVAARPAKPPRLRWKKSPKARYYNVQLFRGKRKVLSAWPRRTRLQLRSAWRYDGRWQRLAPGTYRWYVWPGYGPRAERRYGRVLGNRTFTIR